MPVSAPPQAIPAEIALPTDPTGGGSAKAGGLYTALHRIDAGLLPPEAVDIARRSHQFQKMRPTLGRRVTLEVANWRAAVAAAAEDPDAELPSFQTLVDAYVEETVAGKLSNVYRAVWGHAVRPLTGVLVDHADDIVEKLKPLHDEAWSDFLEHAGQLAAFDSESQLLGNSEATDHYHLAGNALSRFSAVRSVRYRFGELPGYQVTNCEPDLVLYRNPEAMRGKTLPKPTLLRWQAIRELYLEADPWMPLKAEAEALRDQRTRARKEARYA